MEKGNNSLYDVIKKRFLNNKLIVGLVIFGSVIAFLASTKESLMTLFPNFGSEPELTLTATVLDERMYCGGISIEEGEEVMIQKAILDLAINNTGSKALIIKSLSLKPLGLDASFWAGELKVSAAYDVLLDEWHGKLMEAKLKAMEAELDSKKSGQNPVSVALQLNEIHVSEIVDKKFTIAGQAQERFQIRLGLDNTNDYLYGKIQVVIETDSQEKLISEPLWIVACNPEFKLKKPLHKKTN